MAAEHVTNVLSSCSGLLYALRILQTHGMPATSLHDLFRAAVAAKLFYCSPAERLDAFLKRCKRYGYCPHDFPISTLFLDADDQPFSRISHNATHVLKLLLPTHTQQSYNLTDIRHNFVLIKKKSQLNHRHFIIRQLYTYSYYIACVFFVVELRSVNFIKRILY